jgi:hypothetical protein
MVFRLELMFLLKTLYLQKVKNREKSDDVSVTDISEYTMSMMKVRNVDSGLLVFSIL